MKLTNTKVKSLPIPTDKGQVFHWDSETRGFGLRITSAGSKSWIVQGRVHGKTRRFTLGPFELLSADEARKRAQAKLLEMYDGKDPQVEKRKHKAQGETLREVMEDYVEHKRTKHGPLRPTSKDDIRRCVEGTFSDWADKPVATISRDACIRKFRELSRTAPVQTNQSFRNLRALLNWAREKNATADGTYPILPVNPVSQMFRKGGLVQWNPERARATRIPKDKIGAVWAMLEDHANPDQNITTTCISADLISFMLLTGTRVGETSKLTWDHVNLDGKLPTFHLAETKNHNSITLPISSALHDVLGRRWAGRLKGNKYVFPALRGRKGYLSDPRALFKKVSEVAGVHLHPHALRRTFEDVAQLVGIDSDKRRQLLNHLASDVHGQNYANNPDPGVLMPAMKKIGEWITDQGGIARAAATGENVIALKA
ncbi:tyrosine-type recombinase/integrase [Microbulbifer celer]|uniref:Tyrosine-type recombinase/integrase n=1 Tax=Microbulbifer celer TaxID=435905 RepID=A0ABW3U895_9GAMM|nr:integrase family protein [Microbulbifer celer]UFN57362.1 integrase family protein [Microbulbifer celer]